MIVWGISSLNISYNLSRVQTIITAQMTILIEPIHYIQQVGQNVMYVIHTIAIVKQPQQTDIKEGVKV